MTPIECQADIAAVLPAHLVRFERFPGCGHTVLVDAPERAMAVIRDFIADREPPSTTSTSPQRSKEKKAR